jgi:hypothetical protein
MSRLDTVGQAGGVAAVAATKREAPFVHGQELLES